MGDPIVVAMQLEELRTESDAIGAAAASRREARDRPLLVEVTWETEELHHEANGKSRPDILQWFASLLGR